MNFLELQNAVSARLNQERYWTAANIQDALNLIYVEVLEYTECWETETTLTLVPGQTYYDLEAFGYTGAVARMSIDEFGIPIGLTGDSGPERMRKTTVGFAITAASPYLSLLSPLRIWNNQTSHWLDITTVAVLDRERHRWGATGGAPDRWFIRGHNTIGFYPKPLVSATDTLLIRHSAIPQAMSGDNDVPEGIPRQFHEVLELGALCHLKGLEREPKAAVRYWKQYTEMREDLFNHTRGRISRDHISTYGGSQVEARR